MKKKMMLVAALACVCSLSAVTVGPDWCVAYPDTTGWKDWKWSLCVAAEEVCADINESTGLKLKAVPASKAKAPAIWIGAEFAKKAGFDLSGLKWYDNAIAEKDGNIYLFGKVYGLLLLPLVAVIPFVPDSLSEKLMWVGIGLYVFFYVMTLFRGLRICFKNRVSIFYLFFYLCVLEILPLLTIYKCLINYGW